MHHTPKLYCHRLPLIVNTPAPAAAGDDDDDDDDGDDECVNVGEAAVHDSENDEIDAYNEIKGGRRSKRFFFFFFDF